MILTYSAKNIDGTITYGGYSDTMVCEELFVIRIPDALSLEAAAPLLCAGITVYSPLKYFGLDKPGLRLGVVGLGGLGHMAVKFAKAFGANVTVISTSPNKKKEAIEHLGADSFVVSREQDQMQVHNNISILIIRSGFVYNIIDLLTNLKNRTLSQSENEL
jgi:cinnamyl-alcohol dehydrogenase